MTARSRFRSGLGLFGCLLAFLAPGALPGQDLFTRVFGVSPGLLRTVPDSGDDPFQSGKGPRTFREFLEQAGIEFPEGTSAVERKDGSALVVRHTEAALGLIATLLDELHRSRDLLGVHIIVEFIEVEGALYHDWMFENRITGDGTELRREVAEWLESEQASRVETLVVAARSGQRAKAESVRETIYPTEPGTPDVPQKIDLEGEESRAPITAATPSAFETRNVGSTLEVDPVIGADSRIIDLNLAPEVVRRFGVIDWPPENPMPDFTVSMPRFRTAKVTTQVTARHGHPVLIGASKSLSPVVEERRHPIILIFARADVGNSVFREIESP